MKKLVLSAALATALVALAAPVTATPADNGPPATFAATVIALDHVMTPSANADLQYAPVAALLDLQAPTTGTVKNGDYYLEQTALSATRGAPEVAVLADTFVSNGSGVSGHLAAFSAHFDDMNLSGARSSAIRLWHDPGDSPLGTQRAQVT